MEHHDPVSPPPPAYSSEAAVISNEINTPISPQQQAPHPENEIAPISPPPIEASPENEKVAITNTQDDSTNRAIPDDTPQVVVPAVAGTGPVPGAAPQKPTLAMPYAYPMPLENLDEQPGLIECPWCGHVGKTRVDESSSSMTGLAACLCCLVLGCIGAMIPFCCGWAQEHHHFCTKCGHKVAFRPHDGEKAQVFMPTQSSIRPPQATAAYQSMPTKPMPAKSPAPMAYQ